MIEYQLLPVDANEFASCVFYGTFKLDGVYAQVVFTPELFDEGDFTGSWHIILIMNGETHPFNIYKNHVLQQWVSDDIPQPQRIIDILGAAIDKREAESKTRFLN